MLKQGGDVFVLLPQDTAQRIYRRGTVIECDDRRFVARFDAPLDVAPGAEVFAHAEVSRKFVQQSASAQAVLEAADQPVIAFVRNGEPRLAESRNTFRVSTAASDMAVSLNKKPARLLDVSATGVGACTGDPLQVGDVVEVVIDHGGQSYSGMARVQSVRDAGGGKFRCGLHAVEAQRGQAKSNLQKGLTLLSASLQREQLRRLARA